MTTPATAGLTIHIGAHGSRLRGDWSHTDRQGTAWVGLGDLTEREWIALVDRLAAGKDPETRQTVWAVCGLLADASVIASCSPMLHSGLFWQQAGRWFSLASDPGQVLAAGLMHQELDPEVVIDHLALRNPAGRTPFRNLYRLQPGITARWSDDSFTTHEWSGPKAWPNPFREGVDVPQDYLQVFDGAVDDCVPAEGPLVLMLSGGLDSTFLAASLARHASPQRPLLGLVNRPAAQARPHPTSSMVHDEWDYVKLLAAAYPDRILLEPLRNTEAICALDSAFQQSQRGWLPMLNPTNTVWIGAALQHTAELGGGRIFSGATGNFSYSHSHSYALQHFARHGQFGAFRTLVSRAARRDGWRAAARLAAARLTADVRQRDDGTRAYVQLFDMKLDAVGWTRSPDTRQAYLQWMADLDVSNSGASNPARQQGVLALDPFESPAVLRFAAEMTVREWIKFEGSRGYARALACGRVPDEIRLRTVRGRQGADSWWVAAQHRDTYLSLADDLACVDIISEVVDCDAFAARVRGWDWSDPHGPTPAELLAAERLLHTAQWVRWVSGELRRLNTTASPTVKAHLGSSGSRAERVTRA